MANIGNVFEQEVAEEIPGPEGLPFVGVLPQLWMQKPLSFFMESVLQHGDVVRLEMGPSRFYLISHPEHVKYVLQDNNRNYRKGYEKTAPVLGNGLVTSEGNFWLRQRRLMQPAFHRTRIQELGAVMTRLTEKMLERWERETQEQPIDVADEMTRLTQQIIVDTMFGVDIRYDPGEVGQAFDDALAFMNQFFLFPADVVRKLPTPANLRFQRAIRFLDQIVEEMIEERRRAGAKRNDLLTMLVQARDEETGEGMSQQQIRDEVMTIYLAGHETTANALAWTFYFLSRFPYVRRRIEEEVEEILEGHVPTAADVPNLHYTRMVFEETLRLRPSAWMFARRAIEADEIGGYSIPEGAIVMLSPYVTHHRPDIWDNPLGFDPERFAPASEGDRPKFAYFPFGGGPRVCIGNNFALMEAQLIVAMVTQRFRLDLVPGVTVEPRPVATLQPHPGVPVMVRHR